MRPINLTIDGINSFTDSQFIDFEAVGVDNIFCISGTTGSGKTTILDSIILALYSNHSERGKLGEYVNLKRESAKIVFKFSLDGCEYESTRVLNKTSTSKNSFVLKSLGGDGLMLEGEKAFSYLKEKIGLEVSEFTNVVVLQQGEFARFLRSTKADRVKLISKLFSLDRFDKLYSVFKAKERDCSANLENCEKSLQRYESVTDETIKQLEDSLQKVVADLDGKQKQNEKVKAELQALKDAYAEYQKQEKLKKEISDSESKIAELEPKIEIGEKFMQNLKEREEKLFEKEKKRDALIEEKSAITVAKNKLTVLEKKECDLAIRKEKLQKRKEASGKLENEYNQAEEQFKLATEKVESLRSLSAVAVVKNTLKRGDVCPICGNEYHGDEHCDEQGTAQKLAKAQLELKEITALRDDKKNRYASEMGGIVAEEDEILRRQAELTAERNEINTVAIGNGSKRIEEIDKEIASLNAERAEINKTRADAENKLNRLKTELAMHKGAIQEKKSARKEVAPVSEEKVNELSAKAQEIAGELLRLTEQKGVLGQSVTQKKDDLAYKKQLEREKADYQKEWARYSEMSTLFYHSAFTEFVAAEYIKDFTVSASARLGELTGGKYSLSYEEKEGEFFVYDFLSGNEKRGVKTLSGGETFLASLSLAIAISRELARSKNFDFFFIDEGFGTLSPDAIDLVTSALNTLARDCMVGVITHRSELKERIPACVSVEGADGERGSRVTIKY